MVPDAQLLSSLAANAAEALSLDSTIVYRKLVARQPGNPRAAELLGALTPETVLSRGKTSPCDAAAVLAALWLRHDYLAESHQLSQAIDTPTGSYWHAIMHRREGDFWNSKYWLNKCRGHPALAAISRQAVDVINASPADKSIMKLTLGDFDAHGFVDVVEAVHNQTPDSIPADARHDILVALQQIEWQVLFEHSLAGAAGVVR